MSHDQNFKNLILDYPAQALAFFAAEEGAGIDEHTRVTPLRQEQLQERLGERFRELDVPLLVEWPDGRREALLFVIEEETRARRFDIHRLAHYCLDLAVLCETERVVPVVIFLDGGDTPARLTLGGDRHTYLDFRYLACRLAELPWQDYRDSDNLVARLNLPNMAWRTTDEKLAAFAAAVRGLVALEPDPERQLKYADFIDIYATLDAEERRRYEQQYPQEEQIMAGRIEQSRQEGVQQGIQQGMQQGRREGEAAVVLRQLERKFGAGVTPAHRERVRTADADTLLEWSERILTAETIDEVIH